MLEFNICKYITYFSSTNSGVLMGTIWRTWIAGGRETAKGRRLNLWSGKCVQHVRASLNEAKIQSHDEKKKKKLLGKDVSDHCGHPFCNHFRSPGGTYSTLTIKRCVLRRIYRLCVSSETASWTWFPAFRGAVHKNLERKRKQSLSMEDSNLIAGCWGYKHSTYMRAGFGGHSNQYLTCKNMMSTLHHSRVNVIVNGGDPLQSWVL